MARGWPGAHLLCQVVDDAGQGLSDEPRVSGKGFRVNPRPSRTDFIYLLIFTLFIYFN